LGWGKKVKYPKYKRPPSAAETIRYVETLKENLREEPILTTDVKQNTHSLKSKSEASGSTTVIIDS
jgi:hypothetical protein